MLPPNRVFATYSDDTAALETDTMRFLAILSICLMAIFALIESIPETAALESVAVETPTDLMRRAEELKDHIEALRREARELADIVAELARRTAQEQDRLDALTDRMTDRMAERIAERMQATEQWLATQDAKLEQAMTRVASGQEELRTLARRLRSVEAATSASESRIEEAREVVREQSTPDSAAQTPVETQPQPAPLSLRFDTTDAMESLVRQGRIQLFAKVSGSVWRATNSLGFTYDELPGGNVYLVVDSVGERMKKAFRRTVVSARKPEWYVVFDAGITQGIADIARQHRHGNVVIGVDGVVSHAPGH